MREILLIGNPNVGKSTLFNSLTHAHEHTGNFHGVTVSEAKRELTLDGEKLCFYDLPGMYSLLPFSNEEEVSKNLLLTKNLATNESNNTTSATSNNTTNLVVVDANTLRRNLYLCLQMLELNLNFKILVNNHEYFVKHKNKIDIEMLKKSLGVEVEIINAKKQKLTKKLINYNKKQLNFNENNEKNNNFLKNPSNLIHFNQNANLKYLKPIVEKIKNKLNLTENKIIFALNGIFNGLNEAEIRQIKEFYPEIISARYNYIDTILSSALTTQKNYIYGENKLDKLILNPFFMLFSFIFAFFLSFYLIFFLVGPALSDLFIRIFELFIITPFSNLLLSLTDNVWLIEFFTSGVLTSFTTILSFLPQICLMYLVLTILEDSGLIARMCYVMDDFLTGVGLNGKVVYLLLMGLGCNTLATLSARNMKGKNLKIKAALINPYISCMARLPVYSLVATAFFKVQSFWVVLGLYLLGFLIAFIMALVLNKTLLPTQQGELLLEFPPLKNLDVKHCAEMVVSSAVDMFKRLFTVVMSVGAIVWILTHTQFNLHYTQTITSSIAYIVADKIKFVFAPIGLNSAGVVTALFVGLLAKELLVSTMSICNNTLTNSALIASLAASTSVIHFSPASALSFLIFSLIYCPCASNLAVLRRETSKGYMWFAIISQFTIGYMLSFVAYQSIAHGIAFGIIALVAIGIIVFSLCLILKRVGRTHNLLISNKKTKHTECLACNKCRH